MAAATSRTTVRQLSGIIRAVLSHRELWGTGLRQLRTLIPARWWACAPRLPIPDSDYMAFRMTTAYGGDGSANADSEDVVAYLQWCRAYRLNTVNGAADR